MPHAITCPQCNAPITPHRFAALDRVVPIAATRLNWTMRLFRRRVSIPPSASGTTLHPTGFPRGARLVIATGHWTGILRRAASRTCTPDGGHAGPPSWSSSNCCADPKNRDLFDNEWAAIQTLQEKHCTRRGHVHPADSPTRATWRQHRRGFCWQAGHDFPLGQRIPPYL